MSLKYDKIGVNYKRTRKADPYLTQQLLHYLQPSQNGRYLDIGCGTGNYTIAFQQKEFDFMGKIQYQFTTHMWRHNAPGGWYFVSLPKDISKEIRQNLRWQEEGWGRMKATAMIGETRWESAIWFDTKMDSYILPIKAEIRKRTQIELNQNINITIWI